MTEVNITINVDGEGNVKADGLPIKKKVRKLKNGTEYILEMPESQENTNPKRSPILDMMGV